MNAPSRGQALRYPVYADMPIPMTHHITSHSLDTRSGFSNSRMGVTGKVRWNTMATEPTTTLSAITTSAHLNALCCTTTARLRHQGTLQALAIVPGRVIAAGCT